MKRTIKIYGPLAKFLGWKEMEANCNSVAEAIQFLVSNWPDVERHMAKQHYKVQVNDTVIGEDEVQNMSGGDIQIMPVVGGAKGLFKTILGISLIAGSFFIPGGTGALTVFGKSLTYSKIGMAIGVTLAARGLNEMLAPPIPEIDNDPTRAFSFQGIQNSGRAGVPVQIVFGEIFTGSVVINQSLDTTGPHEMAVASGGI
tara:strand:- start:11378 stop:11977 length:600 start_codon:yes stop_codon:yes gene_type:complete